MIYFGIAVAAVLVGSLLWGWLVAPKKPTFVLLPKQEADIVKLFDAQKQSEHKRIDALEEQDVLTELNRGRPGNKPS